MSVNYYNSAGTDLDNLFYVNNGNAGAIGFVEASGQDLGNRYTNASTLGYSVGYVNGSGTDLGYLRGNLVPGHHELLGQSKHNQESALVHRQHEDRSRG